MFTTEGLPRLQIRTRLRTSATNGGDAHSLKSESVFIELVGGPFIRPIVLHQLIMLKFVRVLDIN